MNKIWKIIKDRWQVFWPWLKHQTYVIFIKPFKLEEESKQLIQELEERARKARLMAQRLAKEYSQVVYSQIYPRRTTASEIEVLGKYLTKTLLTPDERIIARKGELITEKLLAEAKKAGLLRELLTHTSSTPP